MAPNPHEHRGAVRYEGWSDPVERADFTRLLRSEGIPHAWEGEALVVPASREEQVDELLAWAGGDIIDEDALLAPDPPTPTHRPDAPPAGPRAGPNRSDAAPADAGPGRSDAGLTDAGPTGGYCADGRGGDGARVRGAGVHGEWHTAPALSAVRRGVGGFVDAWFVLVAVAVVVLSRGGTVGADLVGRSWLWRLAPAALLFAVDVVGVAFTGRTPGKLVAGGRVVQEADGRLPSLRAAALRAWPRALAVAATGLGGMWALVSDVLVAGMLVGVLFRPDRRGFHDLIAGTRVVEAGARR
ncbi:MAG: RDD family protein [Actinobacteria bacterium]|nr:RDD family protein [Actinomycetota bacterium]